MAEHCRQYFMSGRKGGKGEGGDKRDEQFSLILQQLVFKEVPHANNTKTYNADNDTQDTLLSNFHSPPPLHPSQF